MLDATLEKVLDKVRWCEIFEMESPKLANCLWMMFKWGKHEHVKSSKRSHAISIASKMGRCLASTLAKF